MDNLEEYRRPWESDEHWIKAKHFIQRYKNFFEKYRLLHLAQVYADNKLLRLSNQASTEIESEPVGPTEAHTTKWKGASRDSSHSGSSNTKRPIDKAFGLDSEEDIAISKGSRKKLKTFDRASSDDSLKSCSSSGSKSSSNKKRPIDKAFELDSEEDIAISKGSRKKLKIFDRVSSDDSLKSCSSSESKSKHSDCSLFWNNLFSKNSTQKVGNDNDSKGKRNSLEMVTSKNSDSRYHSTEISKGKKKSHCPPVPPDSSVKAFSSSDTKNKASICEDTVCKGVGYGKTRSSYLQIGVQKSELVSDMEKHGSTSSGISAKKTKACDSVSHHTAKPYSRPVNKIKDSVSSLAGELLLSNVTPKRSNSCQTETKVLEQKLLSSVLDLHKNNSSVNAISQKNLKTNDLALPKVCSICHESLSTKCSCQKTGSGESKANQYSSATQKFCIALKSLLHLPDYDSSPSKVLAEKQTCDVLLLDKSANATDLNTKTKGDCQEILSSPVMCDENDEVWPVSLEDAEQPEVLTLENSSDSEDLASCKTPLKELQTNLSATPSYKSAFTTCLDVKNKANGSSKSWLSTRSSCQKVGGSGCKTRQSSQNDIQKSDSSSKTPWNSGDANSAGISSVKLETKPSVALNYRCAKYLDSVTKNSDNMVKCLPSERSCQKINDKQKIVQKLELPTCLEGCSSQTSVSQIMRHSTDSSEKCVTTSGTNKNHFGYSCQTNSKSDSKEGESIQNKQKSDKGMTSEVSLDFQKCNLVLSGASEVKQRFPEAARQKSEMGASKNSLDSHKYSFKNSCSGGKSRQDDGKAKENFSEAVSQKFEMAASKKSLDSHKSNSNGVSGKSKKVLSDKSSKTTSSSLTKSKSAELCKEVLSSKHSFQKSCSGKSGQDSAPDLIKPEMPLKNSLHLKESNSHVSNISTQIHCLDTKNNSELNKLSSKRFFKKNDKMSQGILENIPQKLEGSPSDMEDWNSGLTGGLVIKASHPTGNSVKSVKTSSCNMENETSNLSSKQKSRNDKILRSSSQDILQKSELPLSASSSHLKDCCSISKSISANKLETLKSAMIVEESSPVLKINDFCPLKEFLSSECMFQRNSNGKKQGNLLQKSAILSSLSGLQECSLAVNEISTEKLKMTDPILKCENSGFNPKNSCHKTGNCETAQKPSENVKQSYFGNGLPNTSASTSDNCNDSEFNLISTIESMSESETGFSEEFAKYFFSPVIKSKDCNSKYSSLKASGVTTSDPCTEENNQPTNQLTGSKNSQVMVVDLLSDLENSSSSENSMEKLKTSSPSVLSVESFYGPTAKSKNGSLFSTLKNMASEIFCQNNRNNDDKIGNFPRSNIQKLESIRGSSHHLQGFILSDFKSKIASRMHKSGATSLETADHVLQDVRSPEPKRRQNSMEGKRDASKTKQNLCQSVTTKSNKSILQNSHENLNTASTSLKAEISQNLVQATLPKQRSPLFKNSTNQKVACLDKVLHGLDRTGQNSTQIIKQKSDENLSSQRSMDSSSQKMHQFGTLLNSKDGKQNTSHSVKQKSDTPLGNNHGKKLLMLDALCKLKDNVVQSYAKTVLQKSGDASVENSHNSKILQCEILPPSIMNHCVEFFQFMLKLLAEKKDAFLALKAASSKFNVNLDYETSTVYACSLEIDGVLISNGEGLTTESARREARRSAVDKLEHLPDLTKGVKPNCSNKSSTPKYYTIKNKSLSQVSGHQFMDLQKSKSGVCHLTAAETKMHSENSSSSEVLEFETLPQHLKNNHLRIFRFIQKSRSNGFSSLQIFHKVTREFKLKVKYRVKSSFCECSLKIDGLLMAKGKGPMKKDAQQVASNLAIDSLVSLLIEKSDIVYTDESGTCEHSNGKNFSQKKFIHTIHKPEANTCSIDESRDSVTSGTKLKAISETVSRNNLLNQSNGTSVNGKDSCMKKKTNDSYKTPNCAPQNAAHLKNHSDQYSKTATQNAVHLKNHSDQCSKTATQNAVHLKNHSDQGSKTANCVPQDAVHLKNHSDQCSKSASRVPQDAVHLDHCSSALLTHSIHNPGTDMCSVDELENSVMSSTKLKAIPEAIGWNSSLNQNNGTSVNGKDCSMQKANNKDETAQCVPQNAVHLKNNSDYCSDALFTQSIRNPDANMCSANEPRNNVTFKTKLKAIPEAVGCNNLSNQNNNASVVNGKDSCMKKTNDKDKTADRVPQNAVHLKNHSDHSSGTLVTQRVHNPAADMGSANEKSNLDHSSGTLFTHKVRNPATDMGNANEKSHSDHCSGTLFAHRVHNPAADMGSANEKSHSDHSSGTLFTHRVHNPAADMGNVNEKSHSDHSSGTSFTHRVHNPAADMGSANEKSHSDHSSGTLFTHRVHDPAADMGSANEKSHSDHCSGTLFTHRVHNPAADMGNVNEKSHSDHCSGTLFTHRVHNPAADMGSANEKSHSDHSSGTSFTHRVHNPAADMGSANEKSHSDHSSGTLFTHRVHDPAADMGSANEKSHSDHSSGTLFTHRVHNPAADMGSANEKSHSDHSSGTLFTHRVHNPAADMCSINEPRNSGTSNSNLKAMPEAIGSNSLLNQNNSTSVNGKDCSVQKTNGKDKTAQCVLQNHLKNHWNHCSDALEKQIGEGCVNSSESIDGRVSLPVQHPSLKKCDQFNAMSSKLVDTTKHNSLWEPPQGIAGEVACNPLLKSPDQNSSQSVKKRPEVFHTDPPRSLLEDKTGYNSPQILKLDTTIKNSSKMLQNNTLPESLQEINTGIHQFVQKSLLNDPLEVLEEVSSKFNLNLKYKTRNFCECFVEIDGVLLGKGVGPSVRFACCEADKLAVDRLLSLAIEGRSNHLNCLETSCAYNYCEMIATEKSLHPCSVNEAYTYDKFRNYNVSTAIKVMPHCDASYGNLMDTMKENLLQVVQQTSDIVRASSETSHFDAFLSKLKHKWTLIFDIIQKSHAEDLCSSQILQKITAQFNMRMLYHCPSDIYECSFKIDDVLMSNGRGLTEAIAYKEAGRLMIDGLMWLSAAYSCSSNKINDRLAVNINLSQTGCTYFVFSNNSCPENTDLVRNFSVDFKDVSSLPESVKNKLISISHFLRNCNGVKLHPALLLNDVCKILNMKLKLDPSACPSAKTLLAYYECCVQIDDIVVSRAEGFSLDEAKFYAAKLGTEKLLKFSVQENSHFFNLQLKPNINTYISTYSEQGHLNTNGGEKNCTRAPSSTSTGMEPNSIPITDNTSFSWRNVTNHNQNSAVTPNVSQQSCAVPIVSAFTRNAKHHGNFFKHVNEKIQRSTNRSSPPKFFAMLDYSEVTKSDSFYLTFQKSAKLNGVPLSFKYEINGASSQSEFKEVRAEIIIRGNTISTAVGRTLTTAREAAAKGALDILKRTAFTIKVKLDKYFIQYDLKSTNADEPSSLWSENKIECKQLSFEARSDMNPDKYPGQEETAIQLLGPELESIIATYATLNPINHLIFSPAFFNIEEMKQLIQRLAKKYNLQCDYIGEKGNQFTIINKSVTACELIYRLTQDHGCTCKYELLPPTG